MQVKQLKIHEEYFYKLNDYLNVFRFSDKFTQAKKCHSKSSNNREKGSFHDTVDHMIFCLTLKSISQCQVKQPLVTQARRIAFVTVP